MLLDGAIFIEIGLIDPLKAYNFFVLRLLHELPCVVHLYHVDLLVHGINPFFFSSFLKVLWFACEECYDCIDSLLKSLENADLDVIIELLVLDLVLVMGLSLMLILGFLIVILDCLMMSVLMTGLGLHLDLGLVVE